MNKQLLRGQMKAMRLSMNRDEREAMDKKIADRLYDALNPFDTVLCYVSSEIEVDTRAVLQKLLDESKKRVLVPKCVGGTNIMHFYRIKSLSDLEKGYFGIDEPKQGLLPENDFGENSCCVIPALCYDRRGYRVGFGKGFYDRFLSDYKGKRIGICYSGCIVEKIDNDDTDIYAEMIITDKAVSYI